MRLPLFAENLLYKTNRVLGVEVQLLNESELLLHACICEKSGSSISVPFTNQGLASWDDLLASLPYKNLPVTLVLTGKGLMHKKINVQGREDAKAVFHKVFPSGNEQDFYTQVYYGLGNTAFASVIRKKKVDEIIAKLKERHLSCIDFFLGGFVGENAFALDGSQASVAEWKWAGHNVLFEDRKIKEYEFDPAANEEKDLNLAGISVKSGLVLAFSAAFQYFLHTTDVTHNNQEVLAGADDFRNRRAFTRLVRGGAVFLLVICLGNFLLFTNYFERQKKLDEELSLYQGARTFHEGLSKEVSQKQNFLERSGLGFSTRTSFYVDRLVYDLPEDIQLSYLSLFPVKNRIEKDSVIQFDSKKILVKGFCDKSIVLNNWINLIKTKDFVADIVLDNYIQESEKEKGRFDLSVKFR